MSARFLHARWCVIPVLLRLAATVLLVATLTAFTTFGRAPIGMSSMRSAVRHIANARAASRMSGHLVSITIATREGPLVATAFPNGALRLSVPPTAAPGGGVRARRSARARPGT